MHAIAPHTLPASERSGPVGPAMLPAGALLDRREPRPGEAAPPILGQSAHAHANAHAKAAITARMCKGSPLLPRIGLLGGRAATTHKPAFEAPKKQGPKTARRWPIRRIEDPDLFTASCPPAGADMSLAGIERLSRPGAAANAVLLAEYSHSSTLNDALFTMERP